MTKKRRMMVSVVAWILVATLLLGLSTSIIVAFAADSDDLQSQISDLEQEANEISEKRAALQEEMDSNRSEAKSIVERKSEIDRSVELTRQEVVNLESQIKDYNRLIAAKQEELDSLIAQENDRNAQYKVRLRTMEETGTTVSYWSILFKATSFSDLVDRIELIQEIENSDRLMMKNLKESAVRVSQSREALAAQKIALSEKREELDAAQTELLKQRDEADDLVQELNANLKNLKATEEEYEQKEDDLVNQIAQREKDYQAALEREREEENNRANEPDNAPSNNPDSEPDDVPSNDPDDNDSDGYGWSYPLPGGVSSVTCAYGWRIHPVTGNYSFHTGVDLGADYGVPIYATRSGTVTTAEYSDVYGNYVTINHGDGYSSLYGHMTYSTVSYGEWVSQGEVIGYVGSTGWSTGPHLHFTIYYNGSTVNPMEYVSVR